MKTENELQDLRDQIILRILELSLIQKQNMQDFVVNGNPTPNHIRSQNDVELAALRLEQHQVEILLNAATRNRKAARRSHAHVFLVDLLEARGLHDIVVESERLAAFATNPMRTTDLTMKATS